MSTLTPKPDFPEITRLIESASNRAYAFIHSLSPALVAQYQTQLPDKKLLQAIPQEFYGANMDEGDSV